MPNPQPDPEFLGAIFGMQPKDAVDFLRDKGLAVTDHWAEMLDEAHARAFTVARCAQLDVLRDIRSGLLGALKEGKTFDQFKKELVPLLQKKGWWGTRTEIGADGKERIIQLGNSRRLKTIYQTNLQSAYMAGHMKAQMAAPAIEYLQYDAVMDGVTRPAHRALNGRVYRKDDPIWSSIYPPNGFHCRCGVNGLTQYHVDRDGLSVNESSGDTVTRDMDIGPNPLTGEVFPTKQVGVRVTLENGQPGIMWTDPGFNSSPLASHIFDEQLKTKAMAALQDGPQAFKAVQDAVLSPTRMQAWEAFLDITQKRGQTSGQTMTVGILPYSVANETRNQPVLHVADRLIFGGKALRHSAKGDALSLDDWKKLPERLTRAAWYSDTTSGNIVAVMENGKLSAVFSSDGKADTAYWDAHIAQKIWQKLWVKMPL